MRLEETELAMEEAAAVASQRAAALADEQARMDALRDRWVVSGWHGCRGVEEWAMM